MKLFVWILALFIASVGAADTPEDFDLRLRIESSSQAGLLKIELPEGVYRATRRSDLGDMRIFNAAGEAVPMARIPRESKKHEQQVELPLLPLPKVTVSSGGKLLVAQNNSGANLRVEIDGVQSNQAKKLIPGYLLDVKKFDAPVNEMVLHWPEKTAFEAVVKIQSSDDLKSWRTVVTQVPVLAVGYEGAPLLQNRVKLPAIKANYFRISWVGDAPDISLKKATLIHNGKQNNREHQWLTLEGKIKGRSVVYSSPGLFPVDQVRLMPLDGNDVIPAILYSRQSVSKRWRWRIRTLGYRLKQNGGFTEGSPGVIQKTHDPLWRADLDKGARSSSLPRLQLGWVPEEVAFVARGLGPYTLAVGNSSATPGWLAPQQVIPDFGTDRAADVIPAKVLSDPSLVRPVSRSSGPWNSGSNWILWSVLILGVVVLGVMARGLWRDMHATSSEGSEKTDG